MLNAGIFTSTSRRAKSALLAGQAMFVVFVASLSTAAQPVALPLAPSANVSADAADDPAATRAASPRVADDVDEEATPAKRSSVSGDVPVRVAPSLPPMPLAQALEQRGDLTLRGANATIESALFTISELWNVNIVVGKEVQGTVSGVFKQAPLREILDSILLANGYSYRAVGESLVVQPVTQIGSANPLFRSMTIPIRHSDLDELAAAAQLLKSDQGQVRPLSSARSLLVIDYIDRVESISAFVARMEKAAAELTIGPAATAPNRLEVAYFHTQFVPAENVRGPLMTILSAQGRVDVMPAENRLVVVDFAPNIEMARRVLERIDRPRPQVRITALIYDLSLDDVEKLGLNWNSGAKGNSLDANGNPNQLLELDTETLAPLTGAGGALTVQSLTRNFDITTVLEMLQNANDARLLADPNVTVTDNETAEWKSVSEIPYQQTTQSELGGQLAATAFKEAGITLRVTPTIAADGTVEMLVEPEFSRLAGFTPGENQPIIDTRKASTTVRVANRQTLVIGGLRQRSDTGEFNGIPFLKDIRLIGPLFRSRDTNVRESELLVFIMPEIVGYDDPLKCREYRAIETLGCRLAAIPQAEGCPPAACGGCDPAAWQDDRLLSLPDIEQAAPAEDMPPGGNGPAPEGAQQTLPLRPSYGARFRSADPNRAQARQAGQSRRLKVFGQ